MPGWLSWLVKLLLEAFAGFLREQGRQEVIEEVEDKTSEVRDAHAEIDARPADPTGAIERLRQRRAREAAQGD